MNSTRPLYPALAEDQVMRVADAIAAFDERDETT